MKTNIYDFLVIILLTAVLFSLIQFDILKVSIQYLLIPFLLIYYIGRWVSYYNMRRKNKPE